MIRALLGGSFDPIHNGHVALAARILADGLAGHVHLVVAARSPHKGDTVESGEVRLRLARAAVADLAHCTVEDLEVSRGGVSFTLDTLRVLRDRHPDDWWRLVVGADNLADLHAWHEPEKVLALAELLVFARGGPFELPALVGGRAVVVRDFDESVSSSAIRRELARGRLPRGELPTAAADLILTEGLYGLGRAFSSRPGEDSP